MIQTADKKQTNRRWLWKGAIMFTGIIVAFLLQLFGPDPTIIVSRETTPLRE